MDIYQLLTTRRSVRHFKDRAVDDATVAKLLDVAANAPSGGNIQPVSVVVVREPGRRAELARVIGGQPWVRNAPVTLVFCLDFHRVERWASMSGVRFRGRESLLSFLIGYADVMCAAQSVAIAAESMGLGSVYVGTVQSCMDETATLLELPRGVLPMMLLTLGHPASRPSGIPKFPAAVIAHDERYRAMSDEEIAAAFEAKYGAIDEDVDRYLKRAYVEVVEADKQQEESWTRRARDRMASLAIGNSAQFLFKLRYPQSVMVGLNEDMFQSLAKAGFAFRGAPPSNDAAETKESDDDPSA